jgi:putative photosynthetic complex assembly protein 2
MGVYFAPAIYAALTWWFTTGVILYLDRLPVRSFRWSLSGASVVALAGIYGLLASRNDLSRSGAYVAFLSAIAIWALLEMSFLMGFITGPRRSACPTTCSGIAHFWHGVQAVLYHEFAIIAAGTLVYGLCAHAPNFVGVSTFGILWVMRQSAKLNLFLGVPNLGETLLPPHLTYLKSFFKRRPMNFLFPISVTGATIGCIGLIGAIGAAKSPFRITGLTLLATLLGLALIEHWFLVLPWPSERLWKWSLSTGRQNGAPGAAVHDDTPQTRRLMRHGVGRAG